MKCDELESYYYYEDRVITPATHKYRIYHADDVDAAIAELKDEIKRKEGVGQRWFEQCMEARTDNIRLNRALYKACANWGREAAIRFYFKNVCEKVLMNVQPNCVNAEKWTEMERKCRAKAESYL